MKTTLEELWYWYQSANPNMTEEQRKISHDVVEYEARLLAGLTQEQKKALEAYQWHVSEYNSAAERDAFINGIRFAVSFLTESLCEN